MAKKLKTGTEVIGDKTEDLVVQLTKSEVMDRAKRLANVESELTQHELAEKSAKDSLKAKRTDLENSLRDLARVVRDEAEVRSVRVEIVQDYSAGLYREVRTDTGETIYSRELTLRERQATLFDEARHDA